MSDYVQPKVRTDAFHCPRCGSYSGQHWTHVTKSTMSGNVYDDRYDIGCCNRCKEISIWEDDKMVIPSTGNAPMPNPDMTEEVKRDYNEARDIVSRSPRSSCVLLRLCIEKICDEKKIEGDLNKKIKKLSEQGLNKNIIKALDSVRVIGGEAVHPLQMDLKEDIKTATTLFKIVNYISYWAHTEEKEINSIFDSIPDEKKDAIKKRDSQT